MTHHLPLPTCPACRKRGPLEPVGVCWSCVVAATPLDDPAAIAYRERVASRAETQEKPT